MYVTLPRDAREKLRPNLDSVNPSRPLKLEYFVAEAVFRDADRQRT